MQKTKLFSSILVVVLAASIGMQYLCVSAEDKTASTDLQTEISEGTDDGVPSYTEYLSLLSDAREALSDVNITMDQALPNGDGKPAEEYEGEKQALILQSGSKQSWSFSVEESGFYYFRTTYFIINDESRYIDFNLKIDNKIPFRTCTGMRLTRDYSYPDTFASDLYGNETRPDAKALKKWICRQPLESEGITQNGYSFYLTKGTHTLELNSFSDELAIKTIEFFHQEQPVTYSEYSTNAKTTGQNAQTVQGENPAYVNDSIIYPTYDRTSAATVPSDPALLKLNTIGGENFSSPGQLIAWNVEVPESGYYEIGLRVRQNISVGMTSYRRLLVNGKVPFAEAESIGFSFDRKWQDVVLGGSDKPWLFHLEKGNNVIELECIAGDTAEISLKIQTLLQKLNYLYRQIIMITGTEPDPYRDYKLEKEIPGLPDDFRSLEEMSEQVLTLAKQLGNSATGDLSQLSRLNLLLDKFIEKPAQIPLQLSSFQSYYSSIASLALNLKKQPLEIDYITAGSEIHNEFKEVNFFENVLFSMKGLLGSFIVDYSNIGFDQQSNREINVWVNKGREQTTILQSLAASSFTPKTGISVKTKLVNQSIVIASLSGNGPDVILFAAQDDPINLVLRHSVVALDEFDTFKEVKQRFQGSSMVPYEYMGGTYALPLEQTFPMLFYRKDIFDELSIKPPKTWEEFYETIRVLQFNNMTAGIPNMSSSAAMEADTTILATLIYQNGGRFYNDDLSATDFVSPVSMDMFRMWTSFYKDYGLPYQYDFFNRFRTGEMPLALAPFTMYNQLYIGAPEIRGLWEMTGIPSSVNEDGSLNNAVCGSGTCALILKRSKDQQAAWSFLDWFTSDDIQAKYGIDLEVVLGASGRYATANTAAFEKLPWTNDELSAITKQRDSLFFLEQIPGGYFVNRNLTNAFRRVVFYGENPRDTLNKYNKDINTEIQRKRKEFKLS